MKNTSKEVECVSLCTGAQKGSEWPSAFLPDMSILRCISCANARKAMRSSLTAVQCNGGQPNLFRFLVLRGVLGVVFGLRFEVVLQHGQRQIQHKERPAQSIQRRFRDSESPQTQQQCLPDDHKQHEIERRRPVHLRARKQSTPRSVRDWTTRQGDELKSE